MKDLILFGAYDRFNYGDMLMPLAIERYFRKTAPELLERYRIRHASLTASDLSARDCLPTEAIGTVCASAPEGSALIVTGGEVTSPTRAALFLHTSTSDAEHHARLALRAADPAGFEALITRDFGDLWEIPYLPPRDCLPAGGRVLYNAIGGGLGKEGSADHALRRARFAEASYISSRDWRLVQGLAALGTEARMAPCAVSLIAEGIFEDLEQQETGSDAPYFVVQCVNRPDIDLDKLAAVVRAIAAQTGLRPYLVPLGYASGHEDDKALSALAERLGESTLFDRRGTLSSILSIFRGAEFYIGTSLHGTITAMAYGIPYFPFKKSIGKLGVYLESWSSVEALKTVYPPPKLREAPFGARAQMAPALRAQARSLAAGARANLDRMAAILLQD